MYSLSVIQNVEAKIAPTSPMRSSKKGMTSAMMNANAWIPTQSESHVIQWVGVECCRWCVPRRIRTKQNLMARSESKQ